MSKQILDLTGKRFGKLTVIERDFERQKKVGSTGAYWKCKCDCGNIVIISSTHLVRGKTKSCGCFLKEKLDEILPEGRNYLKQFYVEGTLLKNISSSKLNKNNKSGVRGVSWNKTNKSWVATLTFKGKTVLQKYFKNKQDAINARKEAEEKYFKPILEKYGEL